MALVCLLSESRYLAFKLKNFPVYTDLTHLHNLREVPPPENDAIFRFQRHTIPKEHCEFLEKVYVLILRGHRRSMASSSTSLCRYCANSPCPRDHLRLKDPAEEIESWRRVPSFLSIPPFNQGCTDLALDSASVGVDVRFNYGETVQSLGIQVLDAIVSDLGHVRDVKQIVEIYRFLELPVYKRISALKRHDPLAVLAKPSYMLAVFLQILATGGVNVSFQLMIRTRTRISPTRFIYSPFMCTTESSYFSFLVIEGILRPALRRESILRCLQLRH
ncbi:hypothetical protein EVAR_72721_1 [Eumeta japonica]|uniref:Uncharacterized protein n=1 Tax=Eumeta variegata TaxID=151549 RepID=A0A4C1SCD0_EUMVA|nr:hypothetical protein EVAR_72721_1 [Eumeta japonica]